MDNILKPAVHFKQIDKNNVQCFLCPRNCIIGNGLLGFCGVRKNINGSLYAINYGRTLQLTQETIECQRVFHYAPNARTLSIGTVGCMLDCKYCQNWASSQIKYQDKNKLYDYSPDEIVNSALNHDINIISWTYNDPVVFYEFVCDTSKLAHEKNIKSLFQSSLFVSKKVISELLDFIDIFSISLPCLDEELYHNITGGWLSPVLEAITSVYNKGKHLEINYLLINDINDSEKHIIEFTEWILKNLSNAIPIHFIQYQASYKLAYARGRTQIERLSKAKEIAQSRGIKYCHICSNDESENILCPECQNLLARRYNQYTDVVGLGLNNYCLSCQQPVNLFSMKLFSTKARPTNDKQQVSSEIIPYCWYDNINSLNIIAQNESYSDGVVICRRFYKADNNSTLQFYRYWSFRQDDEIFTTQIHAGEQWRFNISKSERLEKGVVIRCSPQVHIKLLPKSDIAHFPIYGINPIDWLSYKDYNITCST